LGWERGRGRKRRKKDWKRVREGRFERAREGKSAPPTSSRLIIILTTLVARFAFIVALVSTPGFTLDQRKAGKLGRL